MVDGLDRLRHDAVVGRHDDDRNVRYGGAAGAHRRKGFVARRIEEGHHAPCRLDVIGANVLGNTARFARSDARTANVVE